MYRTIKQSLDGSWQLTFTNPTTQTTVSTTASVPGNIEQVLVENKLLADYLPSDREDATEQFCYVDDWRYSTTFEYQPQHNYQTFLVFEGIDTIAEIYLNGHLIGSPCNMHMTYRFALEGVAQIGKNELSVIIRSSELWARKHSHDQFVFTHALNSYYDSQTYLRKARHQWGWDNAPRLITSGIFRSVYLESLPEERFSDVYCYTMQIDSHDVYIGVNWSFATPRHSLSSYCVRFSLMDGVRVISATQGQLYGTQGKLTLKIPRDQVRLWWPVDMGEPFLYTARLEMLDGGAPIALWENPFGIRILNLTMTEDVQKDEGEFFFHINGERLYIRGTNWKPLDPLPSLADVKTRSGKALEHAKALHCNMIRIWGGGIYEDDAFYRWCDQNGMLVWQDFMFACEIPPTDDDFCQLVKEEAVHIIKKYRNHPSLAIWCGDNENDSSLTWVAAPNHVKPSDLLISRKILREAVLHHDPFRSYVASSPYLSDQAFAQFWDSDPQCVSAELHFYPNSVQFQTLLRTVKSRFIGETGPISVNAIAVNERIFRKEENRAKRLWDVEPTYQSQTKLHENQSHQSDEYFCIWRTAGRELCQAKYGRDFSFDQWEDYVIAINLACASIFKDVIEYCRVVPHKTGVIWWSLMDMWPMLFNYSVMDCDFHPKMPYHFIQKSQQAVSLLAVHTEMDGDLKLYLANETLEEKSLAYTVIAYDREGYATILDHGSATQPRNSVGHLATYQSGGEPQLLILRWEMDGNVFYNHAFTQFSDYEIMKKWLLILERETHMHLLELQPPNEAVVL